MGRVDGKVAFITGAGRGQGRSHAVRLAEEGADIVAIDIGAQISTVAYPMATYEELAETAAQVEALDRQILWAQVDVRDLAGLTKFLDGAVAELGHLDVVCANAGIYSQGLLGELDEQVWRDMIDINLTGVWNTCRAAIPHLVAGGRGGSIILTSSSVGLRATANVGHYAAAKHGVIGLMRTLALELGPYSIRVNSVHPTAVDTPMIQNEALYRLLVPDIEHPGRDDAAVVLESLNALPVPWVEPRDVSNAVLFLASDEADFITGVTFPVDAGLTIK